MKKVLLSLLAVAALVLSCQNYDDEFDALNSKIASLESQIQSLADLQTAVTGVQSSVSSLSAAVAAAKASADAAVAAAADAATAAAAANTGSAAATAAAEAAAAAAQAAATGSAAAAADAAAAAAAATAAATASGDAADEAAAAAAANAAAAAANAAAIADLATDIAAIAADLVALDTAIAAASSAEDLAALKTELNSTLEALKDLVEGNEATIATLVLNDAALKSQLDALGIDVDAILAQNSTYTGNISMTNDAEVNFAKSLGDKVKIINGDVNIEISTANGVSAADVSLVTKLIETVVGDVTITTNASIDLSALTSVSGDYVVDGKDVSDDALASAGDVLLDYDGGYMLPALKTAKNIYVVDYDTAKATTTTAAVVGTTKVEFNSALMATSLQSVASGSVTSGGVHSSGGSIAVGAYTANTVNFTDATKVVIGDIPVVSVTAPDATEIELHFDGSATVPLASLSVVAAKATSVVAKAVKITGSATFDVAATGSITMLGLTSAASFDSDAASVTADALKTITGAYDTDATSVSLPALTAVGTLTAPKATSVSADLLKTATTITLAKASTVSLPAATTIGTLSAAMATSVSAPLAVVGSVDIDETGTAISATDATKVGNTSLNLGSVTTIVDASTVTTVTLNAQAATYNVGLLTAATSVTYKGKVTGTPSVDLTVSAANAKLASLTVGGELDEVTVSAAPLLTSVMTSGDIIELSVSGNTKLTTLSTSGTIFSARVDNNDAITTGLTLGHKENATQGSVLVVTGNAKLVSFETAIDRTFYFEVTGNTMLESFDAGSIKTIPSNSTSSFNYTILVAGNYAPIATAVAPLTLAKWTGLKGSYTPLTVSTDEAFMQASIATLKPYMAALANAAAPATGTATVGSFTSGTGSSIMLDYIYQPAVATAAGLVASIDSSSLTHEELKAKIASIQ